MSFNFMAAVTICSDFGAPQKESDTVSTVSPSISWEIDGTGCHDLHFLNNMLLIINDPLKKLKKK